MHQSLPLFHHLLTTVLQFKSRHLASDTLYPDLVDIVLVFYYLRVKGLQTGFIKSSWLPNVNFKMIYFKVKKGFTINKYNKCVKKSVSIKLDYVDKKVETKTVKK